MHFIGSELQLVADSARNEQYEVNKPSLPSKKDSAPPLDSLSRQHTT